MSENSDARLREPELALLELRVNAEKRQVDPVIPPPSAAVKPSKREINPLTSTIAGGIVTGLFAISNSYLQARQSHQLAEDNLRSTLIQNAIGADDPEERKKTLVFFVDTGLLADPTGQIKALKPSQIPQVVSDAMIGRVQFERGTYGYVGEAAAVKSGMAITPGDRNGSSGCRCASQGAVLRRVRPEVCRSHR